MEHLDQQPITTENQATETKREIRIEKNLYLVTSYFSGTKTLEESLIQAIERESVKSEPYKKDEKPSRNGYNDNSNIYSR